MARKLITQVHLLSNDNVLELVLDSVELTEDGVFVSFVGYRQQRKRHVVRRNCKGVISIKEEAITFKWPRKGIYEGKIIDSSGML